MADLDKIILFKGEYHFLSNFYAARFEWDGIVWPHSEAAYQAAKTLDREVREAFATLTNPVAAKRAGKRVFMRKDWNEVKAEIMYDIVYSKFDQNPNLKRKLLQTGNKILEEGNTWGDRTWGICPPGSGQGQNLLGRILMSIRDEFAHE